MFESSQWMYSSGGGAFYDYEIDGSVRMDGSSTQFSRTFQAGGNRAKWTLSWWMKRERILGSTNSDFMFSAATGGSTRMFVSFDGDDYMWLLGQTSSAYSSYPAKNGSRIRFRDQSSWYHIVLAVDTTQATAANRVKWYINGELVDTDGNTPPQNYEYYWNDNITHYIGQYNGGLRYQGYMADINFVSNAQLAATDFGEFKSGAWKPIEYTGSYGTTGFHLEFAGNANDSSGNGNNWTASNINSHDYVIDSPTNNFCTLNPVDNQGQALSQGNLVGAGTNSWDTVRGTYAMSSGKWYWEERIGANNADHRSGISDNKFIPSLSGSGILSVEFYNFGYARVFYEGATEQTSSGGYAGAGDVVGYALDMDSKTFKYYKNGTLYYTKNLGSNFTKVHPMTQKYYTSASVFNFGQDSTFAGNTTAGGNSDANGYGDFKYAPPSGYLALCSANLTVAEGVDPALDASPQDHFNALAYSGTGVNPTTHTGVGFQPDLVWIKVRAYADNHNWFDALRGAGERLSSNTTEAETFTTHFTAFNTDGFTTTADSGYNSSGRTYIAFCWKGNGTGVSNSDGTITSTVSANTNSGFSIVKWTGNGAARTIGHGLDQKPELIILRNTTNVEKGEVMYDNTIPTYSMLLFAGTDGSAAGRLSNYFTSVSATTFGVGAYNRSNGSGDAMIAYCFHSVDGCTSVGKYTGNASTNGPFAYTGFRPAFVLLKCIDTGEAWEVMDSGRDPFNDNATSELRPHLSNAETTTNVIDFLSNGFKIRTSAGQWNNSGQEYVYVAFAENPFKYANAR